MLLLLLLLLQSRSLYVILCCHPTIPSGLLAVRRLGASSPRLLAIGWLLLHQAEVALAALDAFKHICVCFVASRRVLEFVWSRMSRCSINLTIFRGLVK